MTFDEDIEEEIIPVRKKKSSAIDEDIKENLAEEILALSEDFSIEDVFSSIRSMELFKVETDECVVRGCDNPSTTSGYCRYHYIKLWKDVKKKQLILSEGRLAKIIEI
jgi:CRP-like cAMP-binding protein